METLGKKLGHTVVTVVLLALGITTYTMLAVTHSESADRMQRIASCQLALGLVAVSCFIVNFACSITYLRQRKAQADALAAVCAEAGMLYCSLLLIISAATTRYASAVWWRWDDTQAPVYLFLWLIYASYLLFRHYANLDQTPVLASVFGVFAFLDLPMAYFSASIGRPQGWALVQRTWTNSGASLVRNFVLFITLATLLVWTRYRVARQKQLSDELEFLVGG